MFKALCYAPRTAGKLAPAFRQCRRPLLQDDPIPRLFQQRIKPALAQMVRQGIVRLCKQYRLDHHAALGGQHLHLAGQIVVVEITGTDKEDAKLPVRFVVSRLCY